MDRIFQSCSVLTTPTCTTRSNTAFNSDLSRWDVRKVSTFNRMFKSNRNYNTHLCGQAWVSDPTIYAYDMFYGTLIPKENGLRNGLRNGKNDSMCMCQPGSSLVKQSENQSICQLCPAGLYQNENGYTGEECLLECPAGTFSSTEGLESIYECKDCQVGTWSTETGRTSAEQCVVS